MQRIQKTIGEFLSDRAPLTVAPTDTVAKAVALMKEQGESCALVVEDDALVGIFTERDFLNRVAAAEISPNDTPIAQVMTAKPDHLRPQDCISYAINRMAHGGFRNVPVVRDGVLVGNLAVRDVTSHLHDVFADLEEGDDEPDEWVDIGGG